MSFNAVINSTNTLKIVGLSSDIGFENSATVSYVLNDSSGTQIDSGSLAYVAASDGDYTATIAESVPLAAGRKYELIITATSGSSVREFVETIYAVRG